MPCSDGGRDRDEDDKARAEVRSRLDSVTDKLCWMMSNLPKGALVRPDIRAWWAKHQEEDKQREIEASQAKKARKIALLSTRARIDEELEKLK